MNTTADRLRSDLLAFAKLRDDLDGLADAFSELQKFVEGSDMAKSAHANTLRKSIGSLERTLATLRTIEANTKDWLDRFGHLPAAANAIGNA